MAIIVQLTYITVTFSYVSTCCGLSVQPEVTLLYILDPLASLFVQHTSIKVTLPYI